MRLQDVKCRCPPAHRSRQRGAGPGTGTGRRLEPAGRHRTACHLQAPGAGVVNSPRRWRQHARARGARGPARPADVQRGLGLKVNRKGPSTPSQTSLCSATRCFLAYCVQNMRSESMRAVALYITCEPPPHRPKYSFSPDALSRTGRATTVHHRSLHGATWLPFVRLPGSHGIGPPSSAAARDETPCDSKSSASEPTIDSLMRLLPTRWASLVRQEASANESQL